MTTVIAASAGAADAQIVQRGAQFRLAASYNFAFYDTHNAAARSFYAAHYAHFGAYEVLLRHGADAEAEVERLREQVLRYIDRPPKFEPPAEIIAPEWSKIAYPTGHSMDWTHMLHTQLYDILTDDRVRDKKAAGERAIAYYLSSAGSAFATRGYGHAFMLAGGPWAEVFARKYPKVNGILWAYHWHHAAVYEALLEPDSAARRIALERVIRVFRDSVLADPPSYMPLTAQVAPKFGEMFPAAAQIFDNLHMMHDVVNDIMADERIPKEAKGREIERMRQQMLYANQEWVIPPPLPVHAHGAMPMEAMTVPTRLSDGRWLPQGHPRARAPEMDPDAATDPHAGHEPEERP
ncbi:MAG: hypothetical protein ACREKI_07915 [Gemmatimonadota bacterium]